MPIWARRIPLRKGLTRRRRCIGLTRLKPIGNAEPTRSVKDGAIIGCRRRRDHCSSRRRRRTATCRGRGSCRIGSSDPARTPRRGVPRHSRSDGMRAAGLGAADPGRPGRRRPRRHRHPSPGPIHREHMALTAMHGTPQRPPPPAGYNPRSQTDCRVANRSATSPVAPNCGPHPRVWPPPPAAPPTPPPASRHPAPPPQ
jgi:hypothetical protein